MINRSVSTQAAIYCACVECVLAVTPPLGGAEVDPAQSSLPAVTAMAEPPAVIWKHEVQRLLQYGDLVPRLEEALGKFSTRDSAEVIQPVRNILPLQKHHG